MKPPTKPRQNQKRTGRLKILSPLAQLRNALNKTQAQFAEMIGESASYLEKMERGRKPVPASTANLLMMFYGVDPESIKGRDGKLKHLLGAHRLRERIQEWEESLPIAEVDTALMFKELLLPKLDVLHKAAANEQRALHLLSLLDESITAVVKALRLESAVNSELACRAKAGDAVDWEPMLGASSKTKAQLPNRDVLYQVSVAESTAAMVKDHIPEDGDLDQVSVTESTAAIIAGKDRTDTSPQDRGMSQVNPDKMKRLRTLTQRPEKKRH